MNTCGPINKVGHGPCSERGNLVHEYKEKIRETDDVHEVEAGMMTDKDDREDGHGVREGGGDDEERGGEVPTRWIRY